MFRPNSLSCINRESRQLEETCDGISCAHVGVECEEHQVQWDTTREALALDYPLAPVTTYQPAGSSLASSANWPNFQRAPVLQQYANASSSTYARKGRFPAGSRYMSNSLLGCTSTAPVGFTELSASHERINIYSGGSYVWSHASASEPIADPESDNENDELENFQEAVTRTIALITSWARVFIFEPARITLTLRDAVAQRHWSEEKAYERMLMIADVMGAISKSTNYNLESFIRLYKHATSRLRAAQLALEQNELTRQLAMDAMTIFPGLISVTCKVGSLVMVLKMMNMYAPVFRCACPESSKELANLPRILMAPEIELKYFVTLDVLLSLITHRPMFFRYDLDFYSSEVEDLINSSHGPGLRWSHGLPDRLTVVLSGFSTILEQAIGISSEQVEELEAEIDKCQVIITPESVLNPDLMIGRIAVQEVWKYAARIYLYMIGLASPSPKDRSVILSRLWGVAECKKQGTMANDMVRILNDIWTQTTERPAVWADLRAACLRVVGLVELIVKNSFTIIGTIGATYLSFDMSTPLRGVWVNYRLICKGIDLGKTCDGIRASTGCLQCAQVGIKCERYQAPYDTIREDSYQIALDYSSTTDVTFQSTEGFLPALVNWPTTRGAPVPQQHANSYLPAYAPRGRIPGRAQYVSDSLAEYITAAPAGLKRHPASPGHTYTSSSENDACLPARIAFVLREAMSQRHWPEEETHERVVLVADTMAVVSKSTNYDLTTLLGYINMLGSLITVLNMMDMYAPVFRRACSESSKELANLPRILMAPEIDLKYFATLDVLLGAITRRPMFFRYDLDFYSSEVEGLIDSDYGPGLRWSHGLPDRLTVVLAKFNTMLEQAVTLNSGQVEELEADIDKCEAIIAPESELNPDLMIGRITVQEVWKYAAHIYLLMIGLASPSPKDDLRFSLACGVLPNARNKGRWQMICAALDGAGPRLWFGQNVPLVYSFYHLLFTPKPHYNTYASIVPISSISFSFSTGEHVDAAHASRQSTPMSLSSNSVADLCEEQDMYSTWGPAGCRRCAEDGLDCRRRIPVKNSVREVGATNTGRAAHHDCAVFALTTSTPINPGPSRDVVLHNSARGQHSYGSLAHEQPYISSTQGTGAFSSRQTVVPIRQAPTPPPKPLIPPRINNSHPTVDRPGFSANTRKERGSRAGSAGDFQLQAGSAICRPGSPLNYDVDDPENIRASLFVTLSLDREVESNTLPFVVHSITAAAVRFVFAPTLIVSNIRTFVSRSRALGQEARQRMLLIANMALAISSTTDYDLTH
ncbi:hypothetical protein RHS01_01298 [Rhizoctonia solani]|uniref:Uncharacterized protein n=1 Tax=Rhizoctonia solani TaxID=456999 RepID=A0A8H7MA92_9AGAM|nr:hypothetical protein RHS01_01298 [Rhizoctonia solani]